MTEAKSLTYNALKAVAVMRFAIALCRGNSQTCDPRLIGIALNNDPSPQNALAIIIQTLKLVSFAQAELFGETIAHALVKALRPARLRALIILRPSAVFILLRKPCSDLRRRLLGWYVRFTLHFLKLKYD